MKMHTIGADISLLNCLIGRVKTAKYDIAKDESEILGAEKIVTSFSKCSIGENKNKRIDDLKSSLLSECGSEYLRQWFAPGTY